MTYQAYQNLYSSAGKESARKAGDPGSIPGSGRSPGKGKYFPLPGVGSTTHSSTLAWRIPWTVIVHGVTKSQTQLSHFHFHFFQSVLVIKKSMSLLVVWPLVITSSGSYLYTQLTVQ